MNLIELLQSKEIFIERSSYHILLKDIEEEISHLFIGKKDFIDFYLLRNGGYFNRAPYLCYNEQGIKKTIEVSGFYSIPKIGDELNMSISKALSRREGYSEDFDEFIDFHFPFAFNDGDNDFWIDIQSGEVKYIDYEDFGYDSNKAIIVSSSFKDFIMNLKSRGNG